MIEINIDDETVITGNEAILFGRVIGEIRSTLENQKWAKPIGPIQDARPRLVKAVPETTYLSEREIKTILRDSKYTQPNYDWTKICVCDYAPKDCVAQWHSERR